MLRRIIKKFFPFAACLLAGCTHLFFQPSKNIFADPSAGGLKYEAIKFSSGDGTPLTGLFFPAAGAPLATVVHFHGNAQNMTAHYPYSAWLAREGFNVFIFDYRGYGRSEGRVSEEGTYRDGEAALKYLRNREEIDPRRIVFFGRSLGAAVAADLATREECLALILETPFVSIREMAKAAFPFLPIGPLLRIRYDVAEKIKKAKAPILVLHGDKDEVVPFEQGKRVFETASQPKEFYAIRGAHHNDTYIVGGDAYFAALKDFIDRATARLPGT